VVALSVLVAATAWVDSASATTRSQRPPCYLKGSHTVASSKKVRVFEVKRQSGNRLYGCLRSNGVRQVLAKGYDDGYVTSGTFDEVKLAGRFVAWQFTATDISCKAACPPEYDPTTADLHIRDLRSRRTRNVAGEVANDGHLFLTRGGSIGWPERPSSGPIEVNAYDHAGAHTLDTGDGIAPDSLHLSGSTLDWLNAGERRTATLAPRG
jgi:hypothetical protein